MNHLTRFIERMLRVRALGACAIAIGLTGCATPKVRTEHDGAVNFSKYKTFAVLPITAAGTGADPGVAMRLASLAEQTVRDSMKSKGFTEGQREQADFAVLVRGESLPRVEVTNWGYTAYPTYGYRRRGWAYYGSTGYNNSTDVRTTEERTLTVEIFDNGSHKPAWVGWVQRSTNGGPIDTEKVQENRRRILDTFPPLSQ